MEATEDRSSKACPMSGIPAGAREQGSVMAVGRSGEGADSSLEVSLPPFRGCRRAGQEMRRSVMAE